MSIYLLDANVLIALVDFDHVFHDAADRWFASSTGDGWATCAVTENAVLRIVGNPRYRNTADNPAVVAGFLRDLIAKPGHYFWSSDVSLLDRDKVDSNRLLVSGQLTDSYLLAMAVANGGKLATFDRRLVPDAVKGGAAALYLIATAE